MNKNLFRIADEVRRARELDAPIVALESTVITHGLPTPQNMELALAMEAKVRAEGAVPATVALLEGQIRVGINEAELERLANAKSPVKVSRRDFAKVITQKLDGGTTVAGTMLAAQKAGIQVFATGGIGGVHRESYLDISTDLQARNPSLTYQQRSNILKRWQCPSSVTGQMNSLPSSRAKAG
jgi:pseudouridine-5'-phosphate glycosidase